MPRSEFKSKPSSMHRSGAVATESDSESDAGSDPDVSSLPPTTSQCVQPTASAHGQMYTHGTPAALLAHPVAQRVLACPPGTDPHS